MARDSDLCILLVDDEPFMRSLLAHTLRDHYSLLTAADGEEALDTWRAVGKDVAAVVTDIRMPGIDGLALAAHLRQSKSPPPILFISGFGGGGEMPGPFLDKPFSPDQLLAAVHHLVGAG
jgi:CheY-like chemotaxis protein